jgi:hypothetical protein
MNKAVMPTVKPIPTHPSSETAKMKKIASGRLSSASAYPSQTERAPCGALFSRGGHLLIIEFGNVLLDNGTNRRRSFRISEHASNRARI